MSNSEERAIKYVIGSGWWSADKSHEGAKGDDAIRKPEFHKIWLAQIKKTSHPMKVLIVDSASPLKPPLIDDGGLIRVLSLEENLGHSMSLSNNNEYCGWTLSVLVSLVHAFATKADYYVYVEQDCLISGEGMIEHAIEYMEDNNKEYLFGRPSGTPQPLQQSFFILKRSIWAKFLSAYHSINKNDREISPEFKFAMAVSKIYRIIPYFAYKSRYVRWLLRSLVPLNSLPFGCGRGRPIPFSDRHFYFQHASKAELVEFMERNNEEFKN